MPIMMHSLNLCLSPAFPNRAYRLRPKFGGFNKFRWYQFANGKTTGYRQCERANHAVR